MADGKDVAKELAALRKEVYEARTLIIRTDNLLKTFHAELKSVAEWQRNAERRHLVGHVAAYVVLGVLLGGGAFVTTRVLVSAEREALADRIARAEAKQAKADEAREALDRQLEASEATARKALGLYRLLTSSDPKDRESGLEAMEKVEAAELDPFARAVLLTVEGEERRTRAQAALDEGRDLYRKGRMREAAAALQRYRHHLTFLPETWGKEDRALGDFYSGAALFRLGRSEEARPFLERFVKSDGARSLRMQAYAMLGDALAATGKKDEAVRSWRTGLALDPQSRVASLLRRRLGIAAPAPAPATTSSKEPGSGASGAETTAR